MIKLIVVLGPTASGKSDKAVELALLHNGEVISADSRQVYKYLDVCTGKIAPEEMKGVRHHLLGYVEPPKAPLKEEDQPYSVSRWVRDARAAIEDIVSRGKTPIICGGTGMYVYSLLYGLDHDIAPDYELRKGLEQLDTQTLFHKYKSIYGAPEDNSISNNRPRLIRAIEVYNNSDENKRQELININLKSKTESFRERRSHYDFELVMMDRSRDELRERITRRAELRYDAMIDEVRHLIDDLHIDPIWLARVGIEYGVILGVEHHNTTPSVLRASGHLPKGRPNAFEFVAPLGELSEEERRRVRGLYKTEIINKIVEKSLQYAKRQMTWNRKYFTLTLTSPGSGEGPLK